MVTQRKQTGGSGRGNGGKEEPPEIQPIRVIFMFPVLSENSKRPMCLQELMALGQMVSCSLRLGLPRGAARRGLCPQPKEGLKVEGAGAQGSRAEERKGPSHALGISLGLSLGRERELFPLQ